MDRTIILDYLKELETDNNKEWYHSHKTEQKKAVSAFEEFLHQLMMEIGRFDQSVLGFEPKELTFKLVRDTRFSHDKSPYLPAFRAHISSKGKLPVPVGYYIYLMPGDRSFLGGGLFASMFKEATASVRDYIVSHGPELQKILENPEFSNHFKVDGEKLKNVPAGYDKEHPMAELLKYKSWFLEYPVMDMAIQNPDFVLKAARIFQAMKPFNDYLNKALKGFTMPSR